MIIGPFATEALKGYEVVRKRPAATLALFCVLTQFLGWLAVDRMAATLAQYLWHGLAAAGGGTVLYEGAKRSMNNDQWKNATGKIRVGGTGDGD